MVKQRHVLHSPINWWAFCFYAVTFGDDEIAREVLDASHPGKQKSLGRGVRNFNEKKWNSVCREIVRRGNMAKVCFETSFFFTAR